MPKDKDALREEPPVQGKTLSKSEAEKVEALKKQITEELVKITDIDEGKLSEYVNSLEGLQDTALAKLVSQLTAELEDKALPFLSILGQNPDARLSLGAIEYLGSVQSQKSVDILTQIAEGHPDKKARKSARKSLFRLQSAGLAVKKTPDPELTKSRERKARHKPYQAIMSNVDGTGSQLVVLAREMFAGDLHTLQAIVQDAEGIKECHAMRGLTRKSFARFIETMQERVRKESPSEMLLVKIDYNYGIRLLREAEKLNEALGTPVPDAYLSVKETFLESADPTVPNPIYREFDAEKIKTQPHLLNSSWELVTHPLLGSWLFDPEEIKKYAEALEKQQETVLELSPQFLKEQEDAIFHQALSELFDENRRVLYKGRLEKTAYILFLQGELENAKRALAAALALDPQSGLPVKNHPLIVELVRRNITFLKESQAGELTEEVVEKYYEQRAAAQKSLIVTDLQGVAPKPLIITDPRAR